jgi:hypothetical protein
LGEAVPAAATIRNYYFWRGQVAPIPALADGARMGAGAVENTLGRRDGSSVLSVNSGRKIAPMSSLEVFFSFLSANIAAEQQKYSI